MESMEARGRDLLVKKRGDAYVGALDRRVLGGCQMSPAPQKREAFFLMV